MQRHSNMEDENLEDETLELLRERRRRQNAAAQRAHRERETSAEAEQRRTRGAASNRARRSRETSAEAEQRRTRGAASDRARRSRETAAEAEQRRTRGAASERARRSRETAAEAEQRRTRGAASERARRSRETAVEAEERRRRGAASDRARRSSESDADNATRRQRDAATHRATSHRVATRRQATHRIAGTDAVPQQHYLGPMEETCASCQARYFRDEAAKQGGTFNPCCNHGKVRLRLFEDYPDLLKNLFSGSHPSSDNFLEFARNFNNSLAVASMDCKLESIRGRGPYHFRVHGHVYHHVGPAVPTEGSPASYGQLYIMDTGQATSERLGNPHNVNCDPTLMQELSRFMSQHHAYARAYRMLYEVYEEEKRQAAAVLRPSMDIRMYFHVDPSTDQRRYNVPTANEVAVVYVGPEGDLPEPRTYSVHARVGGLTKVPLIAKVSEKLANFSSE